MADRQLEAAEKSRQAILDLLDEALQKIGLNGENYTPAGKIDMLLAAAQINTSLQEHANRADDLLNKIADKLNLPAGADLEGILPLLDEKLK